MWELRGSFLLRAADFGTDPLRGNAMTGRQQEARTRSFWLHGTAELSFTPPGDGRPDRGAAGEKEGTLECQAAQGKLWGREELVCPPHPPEPP